MQMDQEKMVSSDEDLGSSESDGEERELEERAANLEQEICNNKYLYDVHVELIEMYRKLGDLKSMRASYERFAECYPLTPAIWLTWLKEEIKLQSDKEYVLSLCKKAVEDYLSIDVWLEYIQYCIGNCELQETYDVIEKALSAGGLHVSEGSLLWDSLRELELAHLLLHEPLSNPWKERATKVYEAFRRQLSIPLLDMENTYAEWQHWLSQLPEGHGIESKSLEWGYHKALKSLNKFKPFEERLLNSQDDEETMFDTYNEYIKGASDPATCLCLYERAVTRLSLNACLWSEYCLYALKFGQVAENVSKKAVRNCTWDENLWVLRLRILEQQSCPDTEVMACLEQGLANIAPTPGLNLWLCYLEFMRRSLSTQERINKVFGQAAEQLGETGDPTFKILRLQANLCFRNGDVAQARKIWTQIMRNSAYKQSATAWIEYAALEKQFGDAHHLRMLYERAVNSCSDWPQYVADDWMMYERGCGSLQDVLKCQEKCKKIDMLPPPNLEIETNEGVQARGKKRNHENNEKCAMVKRMKTVGIATPPPKKTSYADVDSEKSVFLSNMRQDVGETELKQLFPNSVNIVIPTDRKGNSRCFGYVQFSSADEVENALKRDREPIDGRPLYISKCVATQNDRGKFKYSTKNESNKLFVRGLPMDYSESDVDQLFKPHGAVAVRLVVRKNGRSKGLAYVEFPNDDQASKALKSTDQLTIHDHVITVAISAPPPKQMIPEDVVEPVRHPKSRLQLVFVPRSVQAKKAEEPGNNIPSKSNDDFRKMLFNK